eukprot:5378639-Prymnesium_polylepis.1
MPMFVQPYEAIRRGSAFVVKASDGRHVPPIWPGESMCLASKGCGAGKGLLTVCVQQRIRQIRRRRPVRALRDLVDLRQRSQRNRYCGSSCRNHRRAPLNPHFPIGDCRWGRRVASVVDGSSEVRQ